MQESGINAADSVLVNELSKGNLLAFNSLFRKYSGRLYRFAYGYLKSKVEAEELVQEVFMRIWDKRNNIKEELSFKSFLFTIAFNIIRKHFRARAFWKDFVNNSENTDSDLGTYQTITYDSLYQFINELVKQLPERRKEIFIKSRFEGLSIKEISEQMGISHKTVENQLTDALKFIRSNVNRESLPVILFFVLFIS